MAIKMVDDVFEKYIEISNKEIEKNRKSLEEKGLDVDLLKFKINDDEYENIKNYFRFCILINNNIISDFDSSSVVIEELKKRYSNSKYNIEYNWGRYFIVDNKYVFETDTANSFRTIFYQFLRDYYSEEFYEYLKYIDKEPDDCDRCIYMLNKLENKEFEFKHKKLMKLFNTFAGLYHSLNNVVLVPYGYNMLRSNLFNDIYCLSIDNLIKLGFDKEMIKTLCLVKSFEFDKEFYNNIKNKTRISDYNSDNVDRVKLTEKEYEKYLENTIDFIRNN